MPGSQINSDAKMEALEVEDDVVEAVKATAGIGLSIAECARVIDMDYSRFYRAVYDLERMGRIKVATGSRGQLVILPEWQEPLYITERQKAVLGLLCSLMDHENKVRVSYDRLSRSIGKRGTAAYDAVECLDRKGYLQVLERGKHTTANLYRVYPDRDGPRGYSWP